jgi:CubicO group peptidase (beta-lactamase class C family)
MSDHASWSHIAAEMQRYQADNAENLPGVVFAVETQADGRRVDSLGAGWARDTICEIGSMTKPFIAAGALLALEERGMLDIDVPVHQLPGMGIYADDPIKRQIKLRHLLQHTSGLPHFNKYSDWPKTPCNDPQASPQQWDAARRDLGPVSQWIGAPALTNECIDVAGQCVPARLVSLDGVSAHIMRTYPVIASPPPGTQYSYSTVNYVLVARIIEHLTHMPLNRYLKEKLFTPLGMRDSFFIARPARAIGAEAALDDGVSDEQRSRIADLTLITRDGQLPPEMAAGPDGGWDKFRSGWRFVNPDGGMFSTADDLLNFLGMLRDGGVFQSRRVLSPEIVSLLVQDQGHGHTMGFGFRSQTTPYGQSAGTLEHMGYKMTYFWYEPRLEQPLIGVFLSQRLPNVAVNTNLATGMHAIFRVFVTLVRAENFAMAAGVA